MLYCVKCNPEYTVSLLWKYGGIGKSFQLLKRDGGGENRGGGSGVYALWSTGNSGLVSCCYPERRGSNFITMVRNCYQRSQGEDWKIGRWIRSVGDQNHSPAGRTKSRSELLQGAETERSKTVTFYIYFWIYGTVKFFLTSYKDPDPDLSAKGPDLTKKTWNRQKLYLQHRWKICTHPENILVETGE